MGALVILAVIIVSAWLAGPTNATTSHSHRPPPPYGIFDDDDTHIEVYQTPDGHWHYLKHKVQPTFPLGWFLLGVVLALILIALL